MLVRMTLSLVLGAAASAPAAFAQDGGGPVPLEEITVEAQRRPQAAQDVPVSVRTLTKEDAERRMIKRLDDAFAATANANMTPQRAGNDASNLSIRGVSSTAFGSDPTVGVYVDDVYVGADNGFNTRLPDIEQIEILRGPQGTLYGRNALGGAVNVRTGAPELGDFSGTVRSGFGSDGMLMGDATVNAPIGENAALRISGYGERSDGWVGNSFGGPDFRNLNDYGGRGKLLLKPTEDWEILFSADYNKDKGRNAAYGPFDTVFDHGVVQSIPFLDEVENYGSSLTNTFTRDFGKIISVTAWRGAKGEGFGGAYSPSPLQVGGYGRDYNQFTQELRAVVDGERVDWTVGAFLMGTREKRFESAGFTQALPADTFFPGQPALAAGYLEQSRSKLHGVTTSAYGDATWHVTDRLDVIAGVRLSYDRRSIDYRHGSNVPGLTLFAPGQSVDKTFDAFDLSPRVGLSYEIVPETRAYATISRGYKSGGFNISFAPDDRLKFDKESAVNYELGVKGQIAGGRFGYAASVFYFDWRDQQVYQFADNRLTIANAPKSRSYGGEIELNAQPVDGLKLYAGLGYAKATFEDYPNAMSGADESGNRQPLSSRFTGNLSAEYTHRLTAEMNAVARVDYNWRSAFFWDTANTIKEPSHGLVNVRLGLETARWGLTAFARNLFDKEYRIQAQTFAAGVLAVPGSHRTVGLIGRVSF